METLNELILTPDHIPVLSKQNAATFHAKAKEKIYEEGGAFEYVEVIKFFAALDKEINGDSNSKKEPDKEFIEFLREEISKQGNGGDKAEFKTERGVKFTLAEVGSSYDFSKCNDQELLETEELAKFWADKVKERKEFLKTLPLSGLDIITKDGEAIKIFPPAKSSRSSFKVSLPK
jgi:molybdopterin converting factor small subunit